MRSGVIKVLLAMTVASFMLFAYGFVTGVQDVLQPRVSNMPKQAEIKIKKKGNDILQIVSLGDSLTRGVGDKNGTGYIGRVKEGLQEEFDQKTTLTNLAVSGAKAPDLIKQLSDKGARYTIGQADVIVLTIGGNDLFPGWETLANTDFTQYRPDTETFQANAKTILTKIREVNPDSPIFWVGLYNPFEDIPELKGTSRIVADWNSSLEKTALDYERVYVVPTFDLFQSSGTKLLYSDHFHPNEAGYALMAERLLHNMTTKLDVAENGGAK
ncbi:SGNH/GDSL hydrolase family protein [Ectobacillus antri]|jgi:lysophospholipase L1-like esterase|uniref:SGNH/GDSL hydrolase family protein n=1 Tax=Ectobacillus antri TaxID=2486280 RepID=A0ABT6H782_9BACI|nr:SGNH/GDSL hydrolase family protein [Ectobacillus antri]MDG4657696.1 SGNH/GDSL hydrolase family protein [Ectobacillus antri]MDG5754703.1 SGNH/GDSL hydrolase family protein [Ectobacillus antri]